MWLEKLKAHDQTTLDDQNGMRKMWKAAAAREEAVAEMPSGLFRGKGEGVTAEDKAVGNRRRSLLRMSEWTKHHQNVHDFYNKELTYDFMKDWEARRVKKTWPERFEAHKQTLLDDNNGRSQRWKAAAARKEAVAKVPSGLFRRKGEDVTAEEEAVGKQRRTLLRNSTWTDGHQEFHDFYYRELKYDFRKEWEAKFGKAAGTATADPNARAKRPRLIDASSSGEGSIVADPESTEMDDVELEDDEDDELDELDDETSEDDIAMDLDGELDDGLGNDDGDDEHRYEDDDDIIIELDDGLGNGGLGNDGLGNGGLSHHETGNDVDEHNYEDHDDEIVIELDEDEDGDTPRPTHPRTALQDIP